MADDLARAVAGARDIPLSVTTGVVVAGVGTDLAVNVNGGRPAAAWPAGYVPTIGDIVQVLLVDRTAIVVGPITVGRRPLTGTVSGSPASGTVPVTTTEAGVLACRYVGTAPSIGALVRLDWQSSYPWIWPSAAASVPASTDTSVISGPSSPSGQATSGVEYYAATDSGSWQVGGSWAYQGAKVMQYRYGSAPENRGAWFYGDAPRQLAGRSITRTRVRLGGRLRIGSYNSAATLHLYRHTSTSKPGGDVSRVAGPTDVSLAPSAPAQWVDVPAAWGQSIADSGGGIAVQGSPYAGIIGVDSDPASGQLELTWNR